MDPDIEEIYPVLVPWVRRESVHEDHELKSQNLVDDLGGEGNLCYLNFERHMQLSLDWCVE